MTPPPSFPFLPVYIKPLELFEAYIKCLTISLFFHNIFTNILVQSPKCDALNSLETIGDGLF